VSYYDLRAEVAKIIPRVQSLRTKKQAPKPVKEKGRKSGYSEFKLNVGNWVKQERLLNTQEVNSFVEVSCRAAACPMPLNLDVWDGLLCVAKGQMITTQRGEKRIEDVKVGDMVLSFNESSKILEWKEVIQTNSTIKRNMIDIETEKGILTVTADHPVYTQRGWIGAGDLKETDYIYEQAKKIPWNKGIPRTLKEKKNISSGISKESRMKSSKRMKHLWKKGKYKDHVGKTNPSKRPEVARKIGEANHRRKVTEVTREKIRQSKLGKPGPAVSEKTKKLYSERMKRDNPMHRKEVLENHPVLKTGRYYISQGEKTLSILFQKMKLKYKHQKQMAKEIGYYTVDFFFPKYNKIIEFDGHQSHREHPEKDEKRDAYIKKRYGYTTLRIVPMELNNTNRPKLLSKIRNFLDGVEEA